MAETLRRSRLMMEEATKPKLPRHIKLRHDEGRGLWLILAPERVFNPDEISVDVLKLCDGSRTVLQIAEELSQSYQAPVDVISSDIRDMLQDLADKGVVTA